jgi:hypothetical protein
MRGLCPRAPGIYRFRAKVSTGRRGRPCHFGPWVGARVPSLESPILRTGIYNFKPDLWSRQRIYTQLLTRASHCSSS